MTTKKRYIECIVFTLLVSTLLSLISLNRGIDAQDFPPTPLPNPAYDIIFMAELDTELPSDLLDLILSPDSLGAIYLSQWNEVQEYTRFILPDAIIIHQSALEWIDPVLVKELYSRGVIVCVIDIEAQVLADLTQDNELASRYEIYNPPFFATVYAFQPSSPIYPTGHYPYSREMKGSTIGSFSDPEGVEPFLFSIENRMEDIRRDQLDYIRSISNYYVSGATLCATIGETTSH
jgi:hypothetical protein